jgi:hypothetical protein
MCTRFNQYLFNETEISPMTFGINYEKAKTFVSECNAAIQEERAYLNDPQTGMTVFCAIQSFTIIGIIPLVIWLCKRSANEQKSLVSLKNKVTACVNKHNADFNSTGMHVALGESVTFVPLAGSSNHRQHMQPVKEFYLEFTFGQPMNQNNNVMNSNAPQTYDGVTNNVVYNQSENINKF